VVKLSFNVLESSKVRSVWSCS